MVRVRVGVRVRVRVGVRVRVRVTLGLGFGLELGDPYPNLPLGVGVLLDARIRVAHHRNEQVDEQHVGDHHVHPQQHLAALARPRVDVARLEPA